MSSSHGDDQKIPRSEHHICPLHGDYFGKVCPSCVEANRRALEISRETPVRPSAARGTKMAPAPAIDQRKWWLAIPNGTSGYATSKDAAEHRNTVTWVPADIYKLGEQEWQFNGYKAKVPTEDPRHPEVWISESPADGVHKRKEPEEAKKAFEKFKQG